MYPPHSTLHTKTWVQLRYRSFGFYLYLLILCWIFQFFHHVCNCSLKFFLLNDGCFKICQVILIAMFSWYRHLLTVCSHSVYDLPGSWVWILLKPCVLLPGLLWQGRRTVPCSCQVGAGVQVLWLASGCGWVCHYRCVSVGFQAPCWYQFGRERNRHLMTVLQLPSTDTGWQRGTSYCGVVAEIPTVHCTHLAPPLPLLGRQRNAVLPLGGGGSPGCLCDLGTVSAFPLAWSETTRWQQEGEVLGHLVTVWWGGSVNSVLTGVGDALFFVCLFVFQ